MEKLDLNGIIGEYARECGPHDFGMIEFACGCPAGDPRHIIVTMVEHLKKIYENYDMLLCSTQAEAMDKIENTTLFIHQAYVIIDAAIAHGMGPVHLREMMVEWRERVENS